MSLETTKMIAFIAVLCAKLGGLLFFAILCFAVLGRLSKPIKAKFWKNHQKLAWITLALFVIHGILMSIVVVVRGRPSFPLFGFFTLVTFLLLIISGLVLERKLKDARVSLGTKKMFRCCHAICVVMVVVLVSFHLHELGHPIIQAASTEQSAAAR